jgi:hypothetical protein
MDNKTKRRLAEEVANLCEDWIDSCTPTWVKPRVWLDGGRKPGIFMHFADEERYDRLASWQEFEDSIMRDDGETLEKYLPLFKRLVAKMESRLKSG